MRDEKRGQGTPTTASAKIQEILDNCNDGGKIDLHVFREFPIDGLPDIYRDIIREYADALNAPIDYVAAGAFVGVATAAGFKWTIKHGAYSNSPVLWFMLVGASGTNKTEPIARLLEPLNARDLELGRQYNEELRQYRNAAAMGETPGLAPIERLIIIRDSTPEGRAVAMMNNPDRLLWLRDELAGIIMDFGRYSKSGEMQDLLTAWSGKTNKITRKNSETITIAKPYLNIIGGIQPMILAQLFSKSEFVWSGFNQRWLCAYPEPRPLEYKPSREIDRAQVMRWDGLITRILENSDQLAPESERELRLSLEAAQVHAEFERDIIDRWNATADDYEKAVLSKMKIQIFRLAAVVQIMWLYGGGEISREVCGETMRYCVRLCEYFIDTAQAARQDLGGVREPGKEETIKRLISLYPDANYTKLGEALGVTQQRISAIMRGKK